MKFNAQNLQMHRFEIGSGDNLFREFGILHDRAVRANGYRAIATANLIKISF